MLALVNKPDYVAYRSDLIDAHIGRNESTFNNLKYAEEFLAHRLSGRVSTAHPPRRTCAGRFRP